MTRDAMDGDATHFTAKELRQVLDGIFAFVAILTLDGTILEVNRASLESAGISREDVLGTPLDQSYWCCDSAETQAQVRRAIEAACRGEVVREDFEVRGEGGRLVSLDGVFAPLRNEAGTIVRVIASGLDVTERKEAEARLRESEERIRQITETVSEVFWLVDPQGDIVYISPAYERIWGRSCAQVYASSEAWIEAVHAEDRERVRELARTHQLQRECDEEYRIVRPDGAVRWIRDISAPVRDASGAVVRVAGVAEDITVRRNLETQLRQSQKMEAIGQLAGGVAHDFNNLLTIISGYTDLILESLPAGDRNIEAVQEIRKAGERGASLTRQLLLFSRKQVVAPKAVSINDIVRDTEQMLRRLIGEDISLVTTRRARPDTVRTDPAQIGQALVNLSVNARDAMPSGGTLTIETGNADVTENEAHHRGVTAGPYVVLAIADTGVGMNAHVKRHLFEPFFTTKQPGAGTGLGLAVVHSAISQSGGFIDVASEEHAGSRLTIYLPVSPAEPPQGRVAAAPTGTETILIVEDEAPLRSVLRRVLQGCGYTVVEASDGTEAFDAYRQRRDAVHLVITDVVMPVMGGRELVERLVALNPGVKVLFVSGYNDDATMRQGIERKQVNFLEKPFTPAVLAAKVREILDQ